MTSKAETVKGIEVSGYDGQERRFQDLPTEHHRRADDCTVKPGTGCCAGCGRPMEMDGLFYRAL